MIHQAGFGLIDHQEIDLAERLRGDVAGRGIVQQDLAVVLARQGDGAIHHLFRDLGLQYHQRAIAKQIVGDIGFADQIVRPFNNRAAIVTGLEDLHDANAGGFSALANLSHGNPVLAQRFKQFAAVNIIADTANHIHIQPQFGALHRLVCAFATGHQHQLITGEGLPNLRQAILLDENVIVKTANNNNIMFHHFGP